MFDQVTWLLKAWYYSKGWFHVHGIIPMMVWFQVHGMIPWDDSMPMVWFQVHGMIPWYDSMEWFHVYGIISFLFYVSKDMRDKENFYLADQWIHCATRVQKSTCIGRHIAHNVPRALLSCSLIGSKSQWNLFHCSKWYKLSFHSLSILQNFISYNS